MTTNPLQLIRYYTMSCDNCGASNVPLFRCGACGVPLYCSPGCQSVKWGTHKQFCTVYRKDTTTLPLKTVIDDITSSKVGLCLAYIKRYALSQSPTPTLNCFSFTLLEETGFERLGLRRNLIAKMRLSPDTRMYQVIMVNAQECPPLTPDRMSIGLDNKGSWYSATSQETGVSLEAATQYIVRLFGREGIQWFLSNKLDLRCVVLFVSGVNRLFTFGLRDGDLVVDM